MAIDRGVLPACASLEVGHTTSPW